MQYGRRAGSRQVTITRDTATLRADVIAGRMFEKAVLHDSVRAGGWHEAPLARGKGGWRFKSIVPAILSNIGKIIRGAFLDRGMPLGSQA